MGKWVTHGYAVTKTCKNEECTESFDSGSRWDDQRASNLGWFFQRNGDVWCPEHTPDWVAEWRARKNKKD